LVGGHKINGLMNSKLKEIIQDSEYVTGQFENLKITKFENDVYQLIAL
jgi:hypothetical protein